MTKVSFTLGPWGLSKAVDVWIKAGSLHVATIPRSTDGDWSLANANLITAAPDLYEALQEMVSEFRYDTADGHQKEAWNHAQRVLAKARGEQ